MCSPSPRPCSTRDRRGYLSHDQPRAPPLAPGLRLDGPLHHALPRSFALLRCERGTAPGCSPDRPRAICSTYPVYAFLLERLRRAGIEYAKILKRLPKIVVWLISLLEYYISMGPPMEASFKFLTPVKRF